MATQVKISSPLTSGEGWPQPREQPAEHVEGARQAGRPEEHPRQAHDVEGDGPPDEAPKRRVGRLGQAEGGAAVGHQPLDDETHAVDATPHHERPRRAVPQAADQHREHEVAVRVPPTAAVAAERDVEVVAQPARQRHVPAPPEVLQAQGDVRRVEVRREADAEEQRDADGDVGVAAEVGVDLERVAVDGEEDLERAVVAGRGEDLVHDGAGEEARHHHLLEQARHDQPEGAGRLDAPGVGALAQLGQELGGPHDRAGHEVREEREVDGEVEQPDRFQVVPVGVDHVAHRLEREERDADGQDDLQQRRRDLDAELVEPVGHRVDEEVVVLEVAEDADVGGHRHEAPRPLGRVRAGLVDADHEDLVGDGDGGQQEAVVPVPPAVEHVARDQHEQLPPAVVGPQQPRPDEDDREEDAELDRREQHTFPVTLAKGLRWVADTARAGRPRPDMTFLLRAEAALAEGPVAIYRRSIHPEDHPTPIQPKARREPMRQRRRMAVALSLCTALGLDGRRLRERQQFQLVRRRHHHGRAPPPRPAATTTAGGATTTARQRRRHHRGRRRHRHVQGRAPAPSRRSRRGRPTARARPSASCSTSPVAATSRSTTPPPPPSTRPRPTTASPARSRRRPPPTAATGPSASRRSSATTT